MDDKLYEAILTVTGMPEWKLIQEGLEEDLNNYRMNVENVEDLLTLGRLQGQIYATSTFKHMREIAKESKKHAV